MKWPSSRAPASRNSCRTSVFVHRLPRHASDRADQWLGAQAGHDFIEMLQIVDFEQDVQIEKVARHAARHHLQFVDIAA